MRTARGGAIGKRDGNEAEIVDALRAAGVSVVRISQRGVLDLLCAKDNRTVLIEVKNKGGRLTPDEIAFMQAWQGEAFVVFTVDEALAIWGLI